MITQKELEQYVSKVFERVTRIVRKKGSEYAPESGNKDALCNIREIGRMTNQTPRDICYLLATKHWQSLLRNSKHYNMDTMKEKGTDIIAYLAYAEVFREEELKKEMEQMIYE